MSPRNDEGRPRQGDQSSSKNTFFPEDTPRRRQAPALRAVATVVEVTAFSGRTRFVMTWRCPSCRAWHSSVSRTLWTTTVRKTPCGTVELLVAGGVVAA